MNTDHGRSGPRFGEFVALMAMMMSLVALSIDGMLPALPDIGADLAVERPNDTQLVVSLLFLGMAIGQILYGPLSDSIGRKPAIYAGLSLFIVGCLISIVASSYTAMLLGRVLQGVGAAGPRIVCLALVRDQYSGRAMARVLSFIMSVFILVPVVAPSLGQAILIVAHWRVIFVAFLLLAIAVLTWFALRQKETLSIERRSKFSFLRLGASLVEICTHREVLGYTIAMGLVFGAFLGYLSSSTQILQQQYGLGRLFPIYFAMLALSIGSAALINARLVLRYGMRRLTALALWSMCGLSVAFLVIAWEWAGHPPLWALMTYLLALFFCIGILFGNLNALAMEPLGHIAGVGAAVVGSLSTLISLPMGILVGASYDGTVIPLVAGFLMLGIAAVMVAVWAENKHTP